MLEHFQYADIVIKAAAVADYRPKITYKEKMKKQQGNLTNEMERTKDILQTLGEQKTDQYVVGFAAETSNPIEQGEKKLRRKQLNAIIVNEISEDGDGND